MNCCIHCQRTYKRKIYYERHVAVCQILCKSKKERNLEMEEQSDTPTMRDLYLVVMEMTTKYKELEEKMQVMSKWVNDKKNKINMLECLNETCKENIDDYNAWFNNINVSRKHLEVLFNTNYANGVSLVLQELLKNEKRPLRADENKENIIYLYAEKQWIILDDAVYLKLMHIIDKLFMTEFVRWQTENKDKLNLDDFAVIYANNVKKIMAAREQLYPRIKRDLYVYLRNLPTTFGKG
jgi:hypothetical protein